MALTFLLEEERGIVLAKKNSSSHLPDEYQVDLGGGRAHEDV